MINDTDKLTESRLNRYSKTGKWLVEALGKNEVTISRWCTNEMQLSLETLVRIANALNVDLKDLLVSIKKEI